eukprot:7235724-Ditylum_brightwellii.AAC.1
MAWSWAAHRAASVSPRRPAQRSHMCDWSRSTPRHLFLLGEKFAMHRLCKKDVVVGIIYCLGI